MKTIITALCALSLFLAINTNAGGDSAARSSENNMKQIIAQIDAASRKHDAESFRQILWAVESFHDAPKSVQRTNRLALYSRLQRAVEAEIDPEFVNKRGTLNPVPPDLKVIPGTKPADIADPAERQRFEAFLAKTATYNEKVNNQTLLRNLAHEINQVVVFFCTAAYGVTDDELLSLKRDLEPFPDSSEKYESVRKSVQQRDSLRSRP